MKKLLFVFVLGAFAACGNGGSEATTDSTSVTVDTTTTGSGAMGTDASGAGTMTTDSTTMSTPH